MTRFAAALFALIILTSLAASTPAPLQNGLVSHLRAVPESEMVPVFIGLQNPYDPARLLAETDPLPLPAKRQYTVETLRRHFDQSAGELRGWLAGEQAAARVGRVHELWIAHGVVASVRADRIPQLAELDGVSRIRYDTPLRFEEMSDELVLSPKQQASALAELDDLSWMIDSTGVDQLWAQGFTGEGVLLAIIDSGVELDHSDLADHVWTNIGEIPDNGVDDDGNGFVDDLHGWNFVDDDNDIHDVQGHGTKCTGVAVGDGTQGDTTGAAPDAQWMMLRIYQSGQSSEGIRAAAVQYAVTHGADVISSSLSYKRSDTYTPDYVTHRYTYQYLLAAGVIAVNSTGNSTAQWGPPWEVSAPANCPPPWLHPDQTIEGGRTGVLAIGAFEEDGDVPGFSDNGPSVWEDETYPPHFRDYPYSEGEQLGLLKPDLLGPSGLPTTDDDGGYTYFTGTSSSTPAVAGMLGLLRQANPQATPAHLAEAMMMSALEGGEPGMDNEWGAGQVRPADAHAYLDGMMPYGQLEVNIGIQNVPDGITLTIGDGEIVTPVDTAITRVPRVLAGTYTVTLRYQDQTRVFTGVEVVEGLMTTLDVDAPGQFMDVTPDVAEEFFDASIGEDVVLDFDIPNPGPSVRTFTITSEPIGGLDWEPDSSWQSSIVEVQAMSSGIDGVNVVGLNNEGQLRWWNNAFHDEPMDFEVVARLANEEILDLSMEVGFRQYVLVDGKVFLYRPPTVPFSVIEDSLALPVEIQHPVGLAYFHDSDPAEQRLYVADNERRGVYALDMTGGIQEVIDLDGWQVRALSIRRYHLEEDEMQPLVALVESLRGQTALIEINRETGDLTLLTQFDDLPGSAPVAMSVRDPLEEEGSTGAASLLITRPDGGVTHYWRELSGGGLVAGPHEVVVPVGGTTVPVFFENYLPHEVTNHFQLRFRDVSTGISDVSEITIYVRTWDVAEGASATALPSVPTLERAYPNPFNNTLTLEYALPSRQEVTVAVYDVLGRRVARLEHGPRQPGRHTLTWTAHDVASGVYFAVFRAGEISQTRKLVLMK